MPVSGFWAVLPQAVLMLMVVRGAAWNRFGGRRARRDQKRSWRRAIVSENGFYGGVQDCKLGG